MPQNAKLVELYAQCFQGVKNEMMMRTNSEDLHGRFVTDDQVVNGYLHAMAWVLFKAEEVALNFPETYGRELEVALSDVWGNMRVMYNKPGVYHMNIPNASAGVVMARVRCQDGSDEREFQQAFDVLQDLTLNDIGLGVNDYEDQLPLVIGAGNLKTSNPADIPAKEFFAIANVVYTQNPFPVAGGADAMFLQTTRLTIKQLEQIKKDAIAKYKLV
jgi:hypothetical protein